MASKTFPKKEWKAAQQTIQTRKYRLSSPTEWSAMFKTANDEKLNISQFCRRFDTTRNTVYDWLNRLPSDPNAAEFSLRTKQKRGRPRKTPVAVQTTAQTAVETVEAISTDALNVIIELAHGVRVAFKAPIDDALRFAGRYQ